MKTLPNIHPGEILLEECLLPMNVSQNELARATGVPPRRINESVLGGRGDLGVIEKYLVERRLKGREGMIRSRLINNARR